MALPGLRPKDLADHLLSRGRHVVTVEEAAGLLGQSLGAAATSLHRLCQRGQMFRPARGLYVAIPPQYRSWGAVQAADFIDPLMKFLGRHYYVGLLSAAELHGASHQRPQVFQVLVDDHVVDRDFGRVRLRFYASNRVTNAGTLRRNVATGQIALSSPARTCLDMCERLLDAGGVSNVGTVVSDLTRDHELTADDFIKLAGEYPAVVLRRVGYFLELARREGEMHGVDLEAMASAANPDPSRRPNVVLSPGAPRRGEIDQRWGLLVNTDVELEL